MHQVVPVNPQMCVSSWGCQAAVCVPAARGPSIAGVDQRTPFTRRLATARQAIGDRRGEDEDLHRPPVRPERLPAMREAATITTN